MRGEDLYHSDGDKIGSIEEIYVDQETDAPEWALVSTGMFGGSTFVPLRDASETGGSLRVPYDKAQVNDAPKPDADDDISEREEADLYRLRPGVSRAGVGPRRLRPHDRRRDDPRRGGVVGRDD